MNSNKLARNSQNLSFELARKQEMTSYFSERGKRKFENVCFCRWKCPFAELLHFVYTAVFAYFANEVVLDLFIAKWPWRCFSRTTNRYLLNHDSP